MSANTPEKQVSINATLDRLGGIWSAAPPAYGSFNLDNSLNSLEQSYKAIYEQTEDRERPKLDRDYERDQEFLYTSHARFNSKRPNVLGREIASAFVVPLRANRISDDAASDSKPFLRTLDHLSPNHRARFIYTVPPTVIDASSDRALVFMPLFETMTQDIRPDKNNQRQSMELFRVAKEIIEATAFFTHEQVGAKVVGLGATIPKMTNYGRMLTDLHPERMKELVTTTGHGGTVHAIVETVSKILHETPIQDDGKLGVLGGAGSIGWSSTQYALQKRGGLEIHTYDHNQAGLVDRLNKYDGDKDNIHIETGILDVLKSSAITMAAVTRPINLDKLDPDCDLDLHGKVIIDDSQPGSFNPEQVRKRGGNLVWVVVEDTTKKMRYSGLYTNRKPYRYGEKAGLWGSDAEFPCGAEAYAIGKLAAYESAIRDEVTPKGARQIGNLFAELGIGVAPFQSHSHPVHIK